MSYKNNNSTVLVVKPDGQTEKMDINKARLLARALGLDLVEVNRNSVYKIMDKGKWKYEQKRLKKKNTYHAIHSKEIKFGMRIESHDMDTKIGHIKNFLEKGFDVRITVEMRGRERRNPQAAMEKLNSILDTFNEQVKYDKINRSNTQVSVLTHSLCKRENNANRNDEAGKDNENGNSQENN